ncbi:MAG: tRNA lysidine(34) synthetase TilS [Anaerolineales bacterium]|nr:tRNA lysidine(34) synthetase TilS [Anaerolineales bacterium]
MPAPPLLSAATLGGLRPDRPLVVGFSGGPDSAAMLHALQAGGWPLVAAHLDHGLRPESAAEAEAAGRVAAGYGVSFVSQRVDVAAQAVAAQESIEAAARAARYGFLFGAAEQHGAQAVLVAHTADDQAETLLMHLLRGAGPQGLQGMQTHWLPNLWSAEVALVRPLLSTSRQAVLAYCEQHALVVQHDPSNQDPAFFRNKVRHELLLLMEQLAPGVKGRLAQTAALQAAEGEMLHAAAEAAWRRSLAAAGEGYIGLQRAALAAEPLALQRRVLQRAASLLRPGSAALNFMLVEQARAALQVSDGEQDWFDGLVLLAEGPRLWLAERYAVRAAELPAAAWPQAPEAELPIEAPAVVTLGVWQLRLQAAPAAAAPDADPYQAWLNVEPGTQLTLRRSRPGDRIALAGGTQKLSDLFINAKLPRRARAAWPLLCVGDEIVWVPGLRLAHGFGAGPGRPAVHAELARETGSSDW